MRLQVELWTESPARLPITSIPLPRARTREVPAGATLGEAQPLSPYPHSCSGKGGGVWRRKGKEIPDSITEPCQIRKINKNRLCELENYSIEDDCEGGRLRTTPSKFPFLEFSRNWYHCHCHMGAPYSAFPLHHLPMSSESPHLPFSDPGILPSKPLCSQCTCFLALAYYLQFLFLPLCFSSHLLPTT